MWIQSHQSLLRHRKTNRAIRELGCDRFKFIGHLHALWWWCIDNAPNGTPLADYEVVDGAEWDGNPEHYVRVLAEVGFIESLPDGGYLIHDWDDFTGKLLERRREAVARTQNWRKQQRAEPEEVAQTTPRDVMHNETITYATVTADRSVAKLSVAKRREETLPPYIPPSAVGAAVAADAAAPDPPLPTAFPKLRQTRSPAENVAYTLFEAYCHGVDIDPATVPKKAKDRMLGEAKQLTGYSPDQVRRCAAYLRTDAFWADKLDTMTGILRRIPFWAQAGEPERWTPHERPNERLTAINGSRPSGRARPATTEELLASCRARFGPDWVNG